MGHWDFGIGGCCKLAHPFAVAVLALAAWPSEAAAQALTGPSAFCHETDGEFTTCPDGSVEWSDITPLFFAESNSYLYGDQADLDPALSIPGSPVDTLMLMYDECGRTEPLGPDEYFLLTFDTVEVEDGVEVIERYVNHIFTDGTLIFIENGEVVPDDEGNVRAVEIEGQRGDASFGPSPNCAFDHVIVEFEIVLTATGLDLEGGYSPDPIFWSSDLPPCTVSITGGDDTMNVGEFASFNADVSGGTAQSFQWSVDGSVIKDYRESVDAPFQAVAMQAGDFSAQSIDFYWKGPLGSRNVSVTVTTADGECDAARTVAVERNATDIDRQAEDFYTSNHNMLVLTEHQSWHSRFSFQTNQGGALFFDFHRQFIDRFNRWRSEFGYPMVGVYDPVTTIPSGVEIDHTARTSNSPSNPKPTWFTIAGSGAGRPTNTLVCDTLAGQTALSEFPPNQDLLGCAVESPWHNRTHVLIGGDMTAVETAPRDPVFWRWHNFVDIISQQRDGLTPPRVTYQVPFRLFRFITEIDAVEITFSQSVTGVTADALQVNGSNATSVSGSGEGPYRFTGYAPPALGEVVVSIASPAIQNAAGESLLSSEWQHTLVDPDDDSDQDGVDDGDEADVHRTDPFDPDTDGDGMPDLFEIENSCLDPLMDQANPHDMAGDPLPPMDDADGDGISDINEFQQGSDPCSFTFVPGQNAIRAGFAGNNLPANDDGSTGAVLMGFEIDFLGTEFTNLFVNNNGNLTFDAPLSTFTPFDLTSTGRVIIAPFFADVDTRVGNVVTYGQGTVNGRPAFGATWPGVGCFSTNISVLNFFQVVLIDRSDVAAGDFDIEFNYDSIQWETGQVSGGDLQCLGGASARVGFSNGTGDPGTFFELAGSGVPGAFLDSNLSTGLIHNSLNSGQLGRYVFPVRSGMPSTERDGDNDTVADELDNCPRVANPDQQDSDLNGIGDACQSPDLLHASAVFLQANLDATTFVEPEPLEVGLEPSLLERVARIVEFRIAAGLATSPEDLTNNLVNSLVDAGLIDPADAEQFVDDVLAELILFVPVDVKPQSCRNPINTRARGVLPVAILGTADIDVIEVDVDTVELEGVLPLRSSMEDVATPFEPFVGKQDPFDCTDAGPDGFTDLVMHFDNQEVVEALGPVSRGDVLILQLTGALLDGRSIAGEDVVVVVR